MDIDKKVMSALAVLLTVSYGITMAEAGVSNDSSNPGVSEIPGCAESSP